MCQARKQFNRLLPMGGNIDKEFEMQTSSIQWGHYDRVSELGSGSVSTALVTVFKGQRAKKYEKTKLK